LRRRKEEEEEEEEGKWRVEIWREGLRLLMAVGGEGYTHNSVCLFVFVNLGVGRRVRRVIT